jgi:hypothetical protein
VDSRRYRVFRKKKWLRREDRSPKRTGCLVAAVLQRADSVMRFLHVSKLAAD